MFWSLFDFFLLSSYEFEILLRIEKKNEGCGYSTVRKGIWNVRFLPSFPGLFDGNISKVMMMIP